MTPRVKWGILGAVLIVAGLFAVFGRRVDVPPLVPGSSRLLLEPAQVDLGDVKAVTWHEITIGLRNPSDKPIRVLKLAARCGCIETVGELPVVAPGSQASFAFRYHSRDDAARDNSVVEFWTDESADSKALMSVASQARPGIVAEPDLLNFGELKPGERKELQLTLKHAKGIAFKVLKVTSESPAVTAEARPIEEGNGAQWRIAVTCEGGTSGQFLQQSCSVQTDCQDAPRVPIRVVATSTGNISMEPKALNVASSADGNVGPWEVRLRRVTPGWIKVKDVKETGLRPVEYRISGEGDEAKLTLGFKLAEPIVKPVRGLFVILVENEPLALNIPYTVSPPPPAAPKFMPPTAR